MKHIPIKAILCQLKKDLEGKDAYRGVSLTYSLLANQFGHFSLGFIPAIMIYLIRLRGCKLDAVTYWPGFAVSSFWLFFEIWNYDVSIVKLRKNKNLKNELKNYPFEPSWTNLKIDTITDLFFFWSGTAFACCLFYFSWIEMVKLYFSSSLV